MEDGGGAEGNCRRGQRCDRVEASRRELHPLEGDQRQPSGCDACGQAHPHLEREEPGHVGQPVARGRDPLDEADDQENRDRVVEPALPLQRPRQPPAQGGVPQQREDRRPVGGGDDRPNEEPLEERKVEYPDRRHPGKGGGHERADGRQRYGRECDRPDLRPPGGQAALEKDQREGDDPGYLGSLVVGEGDAADPLAAGEHADGEQHDEPGQAQAAGERGRRQAEDEQHARQEDVAVARQTGIIPEPARGG